MSFTSPLFPLFLLLTVGILRLIPPRRRWMLLLPASYLFYAFHNVWLLGLILTTTLVSYGSALLMARAGDEKGRRRALALDAAVCLGILFVFKYLDFAAQGALSLLRLFGLRAAFDGFGILLPMGISFYVFQTLSYTIDVYRGDAQAEKHLGHYALFVVFFPQLVAGPIERPGALLPQLKDMRTPDARDASEGVRYLLRGYAKKVLVADVAARCVDAAYGAPEQAGGLALMAATALFALQIYGDFSGYTDIAVGCARLMGVRLSRNFDHPYAARTVRGFWRGWHISLTRWFTDYVYIPMGGGRRGRARKCLNILFVFLLSGLWHGADVTYLVWGLLHGLYLSAETLLDRGEKQPGRARHALTLALVCFAWVFFRADSWTHAMTILRVMVSEPMPEGILAGLGLDAAGALLCAGVICAFPALERLPGLAEEEQPAARLTLVYFLLALAIIACRVLTLRSGGGAAFIYFQF